MPERPETPQCPWELDLNTICPKHGVPLHACPAPISDGLTRMLSDLNLEVIVKEPPAK